MEDEKMRQLFADFKPALTPDAAFMNRVDASLRAVEAIRRQVAADKKRSRRAVAFAAVGGFAAGCLFSPAIPYLGSTIGRWLRELSPQPAITVIADNATVLAWMAVAGVAAIVAVNTYEVAMAVMSERRRP